VNRLKKHIIALVALVAVIAANTDVPVSAAPNVERTGATCRLAPNHPWTIVRVTVAPSGSIEGLRVAYHSGNEAFDANAIRLAAATSFDSPRRHSVPASFDYLIASDAHGNSATRVVERLGVRDDAWTPSTPERRVC